MNILALDLGTDCRFAIYKDAKFTSGTKKLGTYKDKFGECFYEFRKWLLNVIAKHDIEAVYFERVYRYEGVEAGHCYVGFTYTLVSVCYQQNIPCIGFSVQAIKKFVTGKGNANKDEMIATVKREGFKLETDDEADAIAIILLASKEEINRDKKTNKKNEPGFFQALEESEWQDPATSLASEFF